MGADPGRAGQNCAEDGIVGALTGIIGTMAALEAIRLVVPFGAEMAGSLTIADLLGGRFRRLAIPPDPVCPACAAHKRAAAQTQAPQPV